MADLVVPFGRNADGRLVLVEEVERGAACACVCPGCNAPLIARKGPLIIEHFAHQAATACGGAPESALHLYAKQVIAESRTVWLPEMLAVYRGHRDRLATIRRYQAAAAECEARVGDFRPDVILRDPNGDLAVEVLVTHRVDEEKIAKIRAAGLPTIEIDLSTAARQFKPEEMADRVLRSAFRVWLYHPEIEVASLALKQRIEEAARRHEERRLAEERRREAERLERERQYQARQAESLARIVSLQQRAYRDTIGVAHPPVNVSGLMRAALMRPSRWPGRMNYPTPGAFCGRCNSTAWACDGDNWECVTCHRSAVRAG